MSTFIKFGLIFTWPLSAFAMGASAISPNFIGRSSVQSSHLLSQPTYIAARPVRKAVRLPRAVKFTTLAMFNGANGAYPKSALIQVNGDYWGTTSLGGSNNKGIVFRITPAGKLTTVVSFNGSNGANPYAGLVVGPGGYMYGTTVNGGVYGRGTVFRIAPTGQLTILESFNGRNGANPYAELIVGPDRNLYGTANQGGASDQGSVFRITPGGQLRTLFSFSNFRGTGTHPKAPLYLAKDNQLYCVTPDGGRAGVGTAFKITLAGNFTLLADFTRTTGGVPRASLMQHSSGNDFYGATFGNTKAGDEGSIFRMTPAGAITTLITLGGVKGARGEAPLIEGRNGEMYGTIRKYGPLPSRKDTGLGFGIVFAMTPTGQQRILHVFTGPKDGGHPENAVFQGQDGSLVGTAFEGGTYRKGTVYKLQVD